MGRKEDGNSKAYKVIVNFISEENRVLEIRKTMKRNHEAIDKEIVKWKEKNYS